MIRKNIEGRRPSSVKQSKIAIFASTSAKGSKSFPKSETMLYFRATYPSKKSVNCI